MDKAERVYKNIIPPWASASPRESVTVSLSKENWGLRAGQKKTGVASIKEERG